MRTAEPSAASAAAWRDGEVLYSLPTGTAYVVVTFGALIYQGEYIFFTKVIVANGDGFDQYAPHFYADGDSSGWAWTGTPHDSTSHST